MSNLALFGYICNPELVEPEIERLRHKFKILEHEKVSPSPLPNLQDTERHGGGDSIYVNSITGDGS